MKKLFCLFLMTICILALWSCALQNTTCAVHIDNDANMKCDLCDSAVQCTQHRDINKDLKCDRCSAAVSCTHKDDDGDGVCDTEVCNYAFCEHEYSEVYSYSRKYHYFEAICGCYTDPQDKEEHTDENNDGICDVCEWNYNHTHQYAYEWSHDKNNHWHEVLCEHDIKGKNFSAHQDRNNDGICDVCLWDYDHKHTYGTTWSHDEDNHWHAVTCGHDIAEKDKGAHRDADNDGSCDVCLWNGGHEHTYEDAWSTNENNHWHEPDCNHNVPGSAIEPHSDNNDDGLCDICEYVVCDNHVFDDTKWESDEDTHWHPSKCGHEDAITEAHGHSWDSEGHVCTICGRVAASQPDQN